ncbi:MAG: FMN-binding protein [Bifidobacterium crudilactis]|jgi:uncharacterized protein with FMN-binding domain|nr:FMN-binding protein [Bifidobacterium crudilactis]
MKRQGKMAITAVSLLALSVDVAAIFVVPELRMRYADASLTSTQAAGQTATQAGSSSGENSSPSSSTPSSSSSVSSNLKDGTYSGTVVSTNRGDFQVDLTVSGGKVTNVKVLEYPQDPTSQSINEQAIPVYVKEALAAQSAQIQLVSGATETFNGFTGSLQDAINQAQGSK